MSKEEVEVTAEHLEEVEAFAADLARPLYVFRMNHTKIAEAGASEAQQKSGAKQTAAAVRDIRTLVMEYAKDWEGKP